MQVFNLRDRLVKDYANFINSFIRINDERIEHKVNQELRDGLLWPEPLVSLNPHFEEGGWVDSLVEEGILDSENSRIFKSNKKDTSGTGQPIMFHKHQRRAIETAHKGDNYVMTTGTGSGKSLCYIVPIVNYVIRNGRGKGIQAIIVYPMNALANSQRNELCKFLKDGYPEGQEPVRFERYTGQESDTEKEKIINNPPDILISNHEAAHG